ncbi:MAG: PspC domain-containing protein [Patescibacteria group bacterium]
MKKTIPTSIANTLFYIEEDAYAELHIYLESIRNHFKSNPDSQEIISDIESRIAEQFIEYAGKNTETNNRIITLEHARKLMHSMGKPEDFNDAETHENTDSVHNATRKDNRRKLYRDPDNAQIGGVASGLAVYFDVDPVLIRLLFILVVLLGGSGILIYIILWILIPEAKTTSQKLEMRGDPINLETVSSAIKEKIEEVKNHKSNEHGVVRGFFGSIKRIIYFVVDKFIPVIGKVIGAILVFVSVIASVALISALLISVIHPETLLLTIPISLSITGATYILLVIGIFLTAIVPIFLIGELGMILIHARSKTHRHISPLLIALWLVGVIMTIVISVPVVHEYQQLHPDFDRNNEIYFQRTY